MISWSKKVENKTSVDGVSQKTIVEVKTTVAWSNVTATPTTLAGYGITDAYTKTESDNLYEPKFSKNTAFNKNFGATATDVATGNHTHSGFTQDSVDEVISGAWAFTGIAEFGVAPQFTAVSGVPFTVAATAQTMVTNLNAQMLGGTQKSGFSLSGHDHTGIYEPYNTEIAHLNANEVIIADWSTHASSGTFTFNDVPSFANAILPFSVAGTAGMVTNLDANYLNGKSDSDFELAIGAKGTAFNKNFGLTASDVAVGNHGHSGFTEDYANEVISGAWAFTGIAEFGVAPQFSMASGAPFTINTTTTMVANLNAELLGGTAKSGFSLSGHNHTGVYEPADSDITKKNETETITGNWTFSGTTSLDAAGTVAIGSVPAFNNSILPFTVHSNANLVTNLNADMLDGYHAADLGIGGIWDSSGSNVFLATLTDKVGIGLSSPNTKIHIHEASSGGLSIDFTNTSTGTAAGSGLTVGMDGSENAFFWHRENNNIYFGTGSPTTTTKLMILSGGNIGISVTNPLEKLHIENLGSESTRLAFGWSDGNNVPVTSGDYGSICTSGQLGTYPFNLRTNMVYQTRPVDSASFADHVFMTGATPTVKMVIKNGGNVGIGLIAPLRPLHINGVQADAAGSGPQGMEVITGTGTGLVLDFGLNANTDIHSWIQSRHETSSAVFALSLNPAGGNVGIGNPAPESLLTVGDVGGTRGEIRVQYHSDARYVKLGIDELSAHNSVGAGGPLYISYGGGNTILQSNGGFVGIGINIPLRPLHIRVDTGSGHLQMERGTGKVAFVMSNNLSNLIVYDYKASANMAIFYANGDFKAIGEVEAYGSSDISLKEKRKALDPVKTTEYLMNLSTIGYYHTTHKKQEIGLIANEVQDYFPEIVKKNKGKYLMDYSRMVAPLLTMSQRQERRIVELEKQLDSLLN